MEEQPEERRNLNFGVVGGVLSSKAHMVSNSHYCTAKEFCMVLEVGLEVMAHRTAVGVPVESIGFRSQSAELLGSGSCCM